MKTAEEILSNTDGTLELASNLRLYNVIIKAMDEYAINILKEVTTYNPNKNTYDTAIDILTFLEKEL